MPRTIPSSGNIAGKKADNVLSLQNLNFHSGGVRQTINKQTSKTSASVSAWLRNEEEVW